MRKWIVMVSLSSTLFGFEFDYGKGTFSLKGGFLGLTSEVSTDIDSFGFINRHENFWGEMFYSYDLIWYDSKTLRAMQHTYNSSADSINSVIPSQSPMSVPEMEYRMKGLDANFKLGYDVIHESPDDFLGLGVLLGVSMPWIDSNKNSATPNLDFYSEHMEDFINIYDMFKKSKTTIMSYKIGPTVTFQKSLFLDKVSIYGSASYAYQTAYIKNSYAHSKFRVNGTFSQYNLGLYFTPFKGYKYSNIYATLGYRYSNWDLDEMVINISGVKLSSDILEPLAMKFGMDTSVGYFGIGYSF
ncbi:MAG: hypothetical protein GXO60_05185 [Epsilonproteobacteria bacterium]|nr:hypothetical protein [Campylobacterota bacterium]